MPKKAKTKPEKQSVTVTMTSDTASLTVTENKTAQKVATHAQSAMADFMDFIREQGVIGLAIAVVLGAAVTKLVGSLVNDIINPMIGILLGKAGDLASYTITIGTAEIMWGSFVNSIIDFVIIALVVYLGVRLLKLDKVDKKK